MVRQCQGLATRVPDRPEVPYHGRRERGAWSGAQPALYQPCVLSLSDLPPGRFHGCAMESGPWHLWLCLRPTTCHLFPPQRCTHYGLSNAPHRPLGSSSRLRPLGWDSLLIRNLRVTSCLGSRRTAGFPAMQDFQVIKPGRSWGNGDELVTLRNRLSNPPTPSQAVSLWSSSRAQQGGF